MLGKIASDVRALIDYDAFNILLVDAEKQVVAASFQRPLRPARGSRQHSTGQGITGAAAESREAVRVADTGQDPRYIASHADIRSELAVPLIVQDRVVGVMDWKATGSDFSRKTTADADAAGSTDREFG